MDIHELRSFIVLAEQSNFGRAAELLHVSQPALSKQIQRMEEALGVVLFDRGRKGARLTALGEGFLDEARQTVRDFDRLLERGRKAASGETGKLRLGFGFHTFDLVPKLIARLRKAAPGIAVTLRDMSTAEQVEGLNSGQLDLGFVRMPADEGLQSLPAVKDRIALAVATSRGIPKSATLRDFRNESFITITEERSPGFFRHMLRLCAKHGFHPRVVQEVPEFMTALALARAGLGVAVIPESLWTSRIAGLRLHSLPDKEAAWSVAAAWRKGDANPALAKFLELLRSPTLAASARR